MNKLTKDSRYIEDYAVTQLSQRIAPIEDDSSNGNCQDLSPINISCETPPLEDGDSFSQAEENVSRFASVNPYAVLDSNLYTIPEYTREDGIWNEVLPNMLDEHTFHTDHFVVYANNVMVHWQYRQGILYFVTVIEDNSSLPLYMFEGLNICVEQLFHLCISEQDVFNCCPYNSYYSSFIAVNMIHMTFRFRSNSMLELHGDTMVVRWSNKKKQNKNKNRKNKNKKLKPWQKPQEWKKESYFTGRCEIEHGYEVRVREHVIAMHKTCATVSEMREAIPPLVLNECNDTEGVTSTDLKRLINHYHKELHSGDAEEDNNVDPLSVLLDIMHKSSGHSGLGLFEDLILVLVSLRDQSTFTGIIATLTLFAKKMMGDNTPLLHVILGIFNENVTEMFKEVQSDDPKESPAWTFTDSYNKYKAYTLHPSRKHIGTIVSLLVTVGLLHPQYFDINGFEVFKAKAFEKTLHAGDIIETTLQSMAFFLDVGYQCFCEASLSPFINASDTVSEFRSLVHFLYSNISCVELGNYEILHKKPVADYEAKLVKARNMVPTIEVTPMYTKSDLARDENRLTKAELDYAMVLQKQGLRETPYAMLIHGPSSIAKSYLMEKLTELVLIANGFPHDKSVYCYLSTNSKWYDSLKSNTQCICLDEVANAHPQKAEVNECDFILKIMNNVFFAAPKAEAHEKGKVMVNNKVFAATTNVAEINASAWSQEPLAVLRRFQCRITTKVKPEFKMNGDMLNSAKAFEDFPDNALQDCWLFTAEYAIGKPSATNSPHADVAWNVHKYKGAPVRDVDMRTILRFLAEHSRSHFQMQKRVLAHAKHQTPICEKCLLYCEICDCREVQSGSMLSHMAYQYAYKNIVEPNYESWKKRVTNYCIGAYELLCPTYLERKMHDCKKTCDAIANFDYLSQYSYFNWAYDMLPSYAISHPFFTKFYEWAERKNMLMLWRHSMLPITIGTTWICRKEYREHGLARPSVFAASLSGWMLGGAFSSILVKRLFTARLTQRRDAAEIRDKIYKEAHGAAALSWRDKVFRFAGGVTVVTAGLLVVQTLLATYDRWRRDQLVEHSTLNPQNEAEVEARDLVKNPWLTSIMSMPKTKGTHTAVQLQNSVASNMLAITVLESKKMSNALMLCSDTMLMPYHMWFPNADFKGEPYNEINVKLVTAPFQKDGRDVTGNICNVRLNWNNCIRVESADLVMCNVLIGPKKDLKKYLTNERVTGQYVSAARSQLTGCKKLGHGTIIRASRNVWDGTDCSYNQYDTKNVIPWVKGDCCTAIISENSNPALVGLHLVGYRNNSNQDLTLGFSYILEKDIILSTYRALIGKCGLCELHAEAEIPLVVCNKAVGYKNEIGVTALNWITQDVPNPVFTYYGTVAGGFTATSAVRNSMIVDDLVKMTGVPQKWGPPNFAPPDESGKKRKWIPWYTGLKNLTNPCKTIDGAALKWAMKDFSRPIFNAIHTANVDLVRPLTNVEILNGINGKRFIDKMNFKSSMGFPLVGAKSKYLVVDPVTELVDFADPIFWEEVKRCEQVYLEGNMCNHIFKACLKDEVVKTKDDSGNYKKARIFQAAPIVLQLLTRKYFLPLMRFYCMRPILSECAVGINCFSLEWEELYSHMTIFVESDVDVGIFGGDYAAWDQRCPTQLVVAALTILIEAAERTGNYSLDELYIMRGIATDLAYCLINFNGSLMRFMGMVPSGHNLTAVLNSNANSLLARVAYYQLNLKNKMIPPPFRSRVAISTYGDDIFGSVHKSMRDIFNIVTYAEYLDKEIGMGFTMPTKHAQLVKFISKDSPDADFLKRHSHKVEGLCDASGKAVHVGVIGVESILKSLYCVKCSKSEEKNVLIATILSALHELFFHGREVYDLWCDRFETLCKKYSMVLPTNVPSYDERIVEWKEKYILQYEAGDGSLSEVLVSTSDLNNCLIGSMDTQSGEIEAAINEKSCEELVTSKSSSTSYISRAFGSVFTRFNNVNKESKQETGAVFKSSRVSPRVGDLQLHAGGSEAITNFNIVDGGETDFSSHISDINLNTEHMDSDLREFFRRPILLYTESLDVDELISRNYKIAEDYFSNPRVANRINNYAWFSGVMCVKFETNGSNFHYGKYIAAVDHWASVDTTYRQTGVPMTACTVLPHIMIDPTDATGGCLEVPLFHPFNMIPFTEAGDVVTVHLRTVNPLRLVNDTIAPHSLNLNVWVWFKDIHLSMPTHVNSPYLVPQAGDEYDKPSVIATTTARAVGSLRDLPVIGPYARATEMALNGIGKMASAFGYSRPSLTNDNGRNIIHPIGNISNMNVVDSCTKLALDAKQEVTVDPMVTGYDGGDSMNIADIAKKRMLVLRMEWTRDEQRGTSKSIINVTPMITLQAALPSTTDSTAYLMTPSAHMAAPFKYWRGSMEITFEVVASTFHKGKIRVVYDPLGRMNDSTSTGWKDEYNINYSAVIDLAKSRTHTMRVGWGHAKSYLQTGRLDNEHLALSDASGMFNDDSLAYINGRVGMHVLNRLSSVAGLDTLPAYVNIYVNMCDDFQVAVPAATTINTWSTNCVKQIPEDSQFELQSGDMEEVPGPGPDGGDVVMSMNETNIDSQLWEMKYNVTHIGESIKSIRQVLKRYCNSSFLPYQRFLELSGSTGFEIIPGQFILPNFPQYGGWSTVDTGVTVPELIIVDGGGRAFIPTTGLNFLTWYAPAYLMRRGSLRNKYLFESDVGIPINWYLTNAPDGSGTLIGTGATIDTGAPTDIILQRKLNSFPSTWNGTFTNYINVSNVLDAESPYQSDRSFYFAQNRELETRYDVELKRHEGAHKLFSEFSPQGNLTTRAGFRRFTAAGEDFSLIYYKYPPLAIRLAVP